MTRRPAVFLDRDGTIIREVGYLAHLDDLAWFPWSIDAIRLLNRAGFLVFVTTNQGGVALGLFTEAFVQDVHARLDADVAASGGRVDAWYYCPHHDRARAMAGAGAAGRADGGDGADAAGLARCDCRKPRPGMIHQAQAAFAIDLARSFVVGDKFTDIDMAQAAGLPGILVRTGHGEAELGRARPADAPVPALVAHNLMEATAWILGQAAHPEGQR